MGTDLLKELKDMSDIATYDDSKILDLESNFATDMRWNDDETVLYTDLYRIPDWLHDGKKGMVYTLKCRNMDVVVRHIDFSLPSEVIEDEFDDGILLTLTLEPLGNAFGLFNYFKYLSQTEDWDFNQLMSFRVWRHGGPKF